MSENLEALADTGASLSIISSVGLIHKLGIQIHPINLNISTADGTPYQCLGYVNLPISFGSMTHVVPTVVVPELKKDLILGIDFLDKFGFRLVAPTNPQQKAEFNSIDFYRVEDYFGNIKEKICFQLEPDPSYEPGTDAGPEMDESLEIRTIEVPENELKEPSDLKTEHCLTEEERHALFQAVQKLPATKNGSLGRTDMIQHEVVLVTGATPKRIPPYRWSPTVERVIDEEVERMKRLGVIEECPGPADFLNPLLPIKKANGKWRICLDSRRLNQFTKKDDYPFPNMMGILQRIQRSTYFTVIDLSESYYQVALEEHSKDKTAFRTNKGLFRFVVMPFGLTNAPATMARLMARVLGHDLEPRVYVYLDNIIIMSNSFSEHPELISEVASRLRRAGLTINLAKSHF